MTSPDGQKGEALTINRSIVHPASEDMRQDSK